MRHELLARRVMGSLVGSQSVTAPEKAFESWFLQGEDTG